ncbi:flagellar assembly protein FliW [Proteinivorax hydrogeniformans]|uniref:Flagellar assembly factor FliW n=1 Tax=Proteinivorax hydrogeniformans TaxID=1826727 RepID=A0AAU8HUY7_9FIRM
METAKKLNQQKIINFPKGLLGFEQFKDYIILEEPESNGLLYWLESVDDPSVALLVTPPQMFVDYKVKIDIDKLEGIGITEESETEVLSVVNLPEDITKATMNLKAPVIINHQTMQGQQVVLDNDSLSIKHPLYKKESK